MAEKGSALLSPETTAFTNDAKFLEDARITPTTFNESAATPGLPASPKAGLNVAWGSAQNGNAMLPEKTIEKVQDAIKDGQLNEYTAAKALQSGAVSSTPEVTQAELNRIRALIEEEEEPHKRVARALGFNSTTMKDVMAISAAMQSFMQPAPAMGSQTQTNQMVATHESVVEPQVPAVPALVEQAKAKAVNPSVEQTQNEVSAHAEPKPAEPKGLANAVESPQKLIKIFGENAGDKPLTTTVESLKNAPNFDPAMVTHNFKPMPTLGTKPGGRGGPSMN